jgi:hypothetical protein
MPPESDSLAHPDRRRNCASFRPALTGVWGIRRRAALSNSPIAGSGYQPTPGARTRQKSRRENPNERRLLGFLAAHECSYPCPETEMRDSERN